MGLLDARAVPERYAELGPLLAFERGDREDINLVLDEGLVVLPEARVVEHRGRRSAARDMID